MTVTCSIHFTGCSPVAHRAINKSISIYTASKNTGRTLLLYSGIKNYHDRTKDDDGIASLTKIERVGLTMIQQTIQRESITSWYIDDRALSPFDLKITNISKLLLAETWSNYPIEHYCHASPVMPIPSYGWVRNIGLSLVSDGYLYMIALMSQLKLKFPNQLSYQEWHFSHQSWKYEY